MVKMINPFELDMIPPFTGFPDNALRFFTELKKNNNREWFKKNREWFQSALREPMESLLAVIGEKLRLIDPEIVIEPKQAIYRIYRDVRFSKDKSPYKTHIAASFTCQGWNKNSDPGFYFHITDTEVGIGGGLYAPSSQQLKNVRIAVSENPDELRAVISGEKFIRLFGELQGEALPRMPQGYDPDHPAAELLKLKQYLCWIVLQPETAYRENFPDVLIEHFAAMMPLVRYLLKHSSR